MRKLKRSYLFLLIIIIVGIIAGIFFSNILSVNDQKMVYTRITSFFNDLKDDVTLDYYQNFFSIFKNHFIYILIIIVFSLSIIGLVLNNFLLFLKSFIMGFTIGSIINIYFYSGIILSFFYLFPVQLFNILLYVILIYYANNLSMNLFYNIFKKKDYPLLSIIKKNIKIVGIITFLLCLSSLFEVFLTPYILKLFVFLIE